MFEVTTLLFFRVNGDLVVAVRMYILAEFVFTVEVTIWVANDVAGVELTIVGEDVVSDGDDT